jgi:hypothetical protein
MSDKKIRQLARRFMNEQKKILEEHGDRVVRGKYHQAVASAERTFREIASATAKAKSASASS